MAIGIEESWLAAIVNARVVEAMVRIDDREGVQIWRLHSGFGEMRADVTLDPPHRFGVGLDGGSFRGRWDYELEPVGSGTRLTVVERGVIDNPLVRGMMCFSDPRASMRRFLRGLATRLGEEDIEIESMDPT